MARVPPTRIAYLTGRYPTISHTFILREVQALRELGVDVHTFSIWRSAPDELLAEGDREEAERTFNILPLRPGRLILGHLTALARSPLGYARMVSHAFKTASKGLRGRVLAVTWVAEAPVLWRELRKREIRHVHAHLPGTAPSVAMLATELASRADRKRDHSWSLTVHGPAEFYDVINQGVAEKVRSADFAVAISDFGRSQLMGLVDQEHWAKLHVVHCGVDPAASSPHAAAQAAGPVRLLSVGRLAPVKGHALLLQVVRVLRERGVDAHLTIVGDGPKRADLDRLADEIGVSDRTELTGPVGQDQIGSHYADADVYIHASFAEGIPVVVMEAMAHGVPVVCAGVMGVRELVRDGENGLVVRPGRVDELVDAVERLARSGEERRRMGEAGRKTVEQDFDVRAAAARLRDLFAAHAAS